MRRTEQSTGTLGNTIRRRSGVTRRFFATLVHLSGPAAAASMIHGCGSGGGGMHSAGTNPGPLQDTPTVRMQVDGAKYSDSGSLSASESPTDTALDPLLLSNLPAVCACASSVWHEQGVDLHGAALSSCNVDLPVRSFSLQPIADTSGRIVTDAMVRHGVMYGNRHGRPLFPHQWAGVQLAATIDCADGAGSGQVVARIAGVQPYEGKTTALHGAYVYDVELYDPIGKQWEPMCRSHSGELESEIGAIPSPEVWDRSGAPRKEPGAFTFACLDAAVGKCYQWGYVPWNEPHGRVPMSDLHWACTRMARADYCGDGRSYTKEGTCVNVWDTAEVVPRSGPGATCGHAETDAGNPAIEAFWGKHGATCVNHLRYGDLAPGTCTLPSPCTKQPDAHMQGVVINESVPQ